ncbi:MAG: hypothetical protein K6E94_05725, partial [Elusimicrobiaceae bacterium]|nr:hypothetical protein [Elusimicrobiaceae bacterium]
DLRYNLFFRRDSKGKLIITFIDFEYWKDGDDMGNLEEIRKRLESVGAKEKADEGISVQPKLTPKLSNYLIPTIMGGLGLTMLLNGITEPGLALAALPVFATFRKPSIPLQYKITQDFLGIRKRFHRDLFQGPELSAGETDKMKEILGEDFFNLWQKYYNGDITDIVTQNTDEAAEYVHFSNRYENSLISLIFRRFDNASNPLFIEHMKGLSASFAQDLLDGKNIKEAFTQMGQEMFEHHKKINQIASFENYKKWYKRVNWSTVKSPSGYGLLSSKHNHDVGFGILRRAEPSTWSVAIRPTVYSEYLERAKTQYNHPKDNKYKGVRLTYFDEYDEKYDMVLLIYPSVYDRNTVSNIESLFNALQDDWEQIKPIILKVQAGGDLTGSEIQYLHENIADMSYLWANVVPFYRGSASGNLVMVYALYNAAGIIAPKVKLGKALDLEAFITTPEEYKANWLNLFDGKFEVVTPENPVVSAQQKEIPAQVLFSGEHKTDLSISQEDSKEIMKYLPSGFLEDNTIYRGMHFSVNSYEDLETVLKVGLLTNKTQGVETIFFSPSVEMAIDYAKRVKEGEIPILVKMPYKQPNSRREEFNSLIDNSGIRTAPPSNEVFFSDDIEADKLTGTLVWAELDGKKGWWKAVVNENGEIILQATDNMQTVTAPAVKPESTPKLLNYLMPAIGVGLGLTMLLNGAAEPGLAMAALPLLANYELKDNIVSSEVVKVDKYSPADAYAVWKLKDDSGTIKKYLKFTTQDEISRTRLFNRIFTSKKLQEKHPLIFVEYPKVVSTHWLSLPNQIEKEIKFQIPSIMPLLREKPNKPVKPMIITPVNTSGFVLKNKVSLAPLYLLLQNDASALSLYEAQAEAKSALRNIPITNE